MQKKYLMIGAVLMALSVALGAFGAHILTTMISAKSIETFKTGVQYHMIHAMGILLTTIIAGQWGNDKKLLWANRLFFVGIILFSGSLYGLAVTGMKWFGPITPLGGVSFIGGWIMFILAIFKNKKLV